MRQEISIAIMNSGNNIRQLPKRLFADVPWVECPEHGVRLMKVPWAESGSGFTALFERLAIDWLKESSTTAVARLLGLNWNAVDGIMQRAVKRGFSRRDRELVRHTGVDETAFQKRHEYVTVVTDQEGNRVLHVADERGQRAHFNQLRTATAKTARAWAIKETSAARCGITTSAAHGQSRLGGGFCWPGCRAAGLSPWSKAARIIRKHLWGIINAIVLKVSNGKGEGMNSRIQKLKSRAPGFRNQCHELSTHTIW